MLHPLRDEILMTLTEFDDRPYTAAEIANIINARGFYSKANGNPVSAVDVAQSISRCIYSDRQNGVNNTIKVYSGRPNGYM